MKINLNTILAILGGLGVFAPDVAGLASWLASLHVSWLAYPIRGLGLLAVFFAAAPLVVPRLRSFLALLGLATPPGAKAPWIPGKDAVVPSPQMGVPPQSSQLDITAVHENVGAVSFPTLDSEAKTPVRPPRGVVLNPPPPKGYITPIKPRDPTKT